MAGLAADGKGVVNGAAEEIVMGLGEGLGVLNAREAGVGEPEVLGVVDHVQFGSADFVPPAIVDEPGDAVGGGDAALFRPVELVFHLRNFGQGYAVAFPMRKFFGNGVPDEVAGADAVLAGDADQTIFGTNGEADVGGLVIFALH